MSDRETIRVNLYDGSYGDGLCMTLPDAVAWMQELERQVPAEHKEASRFLVEQEHDYYGGSSSLTLVAYYDRPETDKEVAQRLAAQAASEAEARRHNEARERQIFEQLKRKYGER